MKAAIVTLRLNSHIIAIYIIDLINIGLIYWMNVLKTLKTCCSELFNMTTHAIMHVTKVIGSMNSSLPEIKTWSCGI